MDLRQRLIKLAAKDPYQFPTSWKYPKGTSATDEARRQELAMWRDWKESGEDPKKLQPLMQSLKPMIQHRLKTFAPANIHKPALEAHANTIVVGVLRKYDPTKAQLNTPLTKHLQGLQRWTMNHQNFSRAPEARTKLIGPYQNANQELTDLYGREPTVQELADRMKVSVKTISKLQGELRADLIASNSEDPFLDESTVHREVLDLLHTSLSPEELQVWELWYGYGGKPKLKKGGDIAKKLGWSDAKVSQVKKRILDKYRSYTESLG